MTNTGLVTWGAGVKTLRDIKGWTQEELAEAANVTQPTISRLENGSRRLSDASRVRIAKALGVRTHELFPYPEQEAS